MRRVTRPGGRVAVLELLEPGGGLAGRAARLHVRHLVPRIGALLSGREEYHYLQASIRRFPPPGAFAAMMRESGLETIEVRSLAFGACGLFVATPASGAASSPAGPAGGSGS
jgi:demethylmenaquinone methyltransferase/2-methoxy-6-polyprenyl-1,4-benzoquinol methylase